MKTLFVASLLIGSGFVFLSGCDSSDISSQMLDDNAAQSQEEYFKYAIDMLQRINESSGNIMCQQVVDQLNQWIPSQKLPESWKPDPMLKELPKEIQPQKLDATDFLTSDGFELQQAIWMRDLSKWVCSDSHDTVQRGARLFDWIVRNIQLRKTPADGYEAIPKQPWEALFFGKGIAVERAWVFVLAAQQQAMDAVILSVPSKEDPKKLIPWAIGLVEGEELYLFEPELGLPIPAKNGISFEKGQLIVKPATLSQILEDPTLLETLDVSKTKRYPITIEQIKQVVAMIPASAASLSARFALVESRMVGDQRAILTAHPSAFAKELRKVKGLSADRIRLWPHPFIVDEKRTKLGPREEATLANAMRPFTVGKKSPLWKGRAAHIMGKLTGKQGATFYYRKAKLPERKLAEHEERFTSTPSLKKEKIAQIMKAYYMAKDDACYWLALVNYSLGNVEASLGKFETSLGKFEASRDYLNRTIKPPIHHQFTVPISLKPQWIPGAYYNLGRCDERVGLIQNAFQRYFMTKNAADAYGNELRATWLQLTLQQPVIFPGELP